MIVFFTNGFSLLLSKSKPDVLGRKCCVFVSMNVSSVPAGLSLVESYPYEPEERGSDYVRLASIAAGEPFKKK